MMKASLGAALRLVRKRLSPVSGAAGGASLPARAAVRDLHDPPDSGVVEAAARLRAIALPRARVLATRRKQLLAHLRPRRAPMALPALGRRAALLSVPIMTLLAAAWALASAAAALWQLARLLAAVQCAEAATQCPRLDAAGRVLVACAGYFALLVALRQLARALTLRGWARLRLIAAVLLTVPCLWLFATGADLVFGLPPLALAPAAFKQLALVVILGHTLALAVLTAGRAPAPELPLPAPAPRTWEEAPDADDATTVPLPILRFDAAPEAASAARDGREETEPDAFASSGSGMRVSGLLHVLSPVPEEATLSDSTSAPPTAAATPAQ
jgi:hypothetical protein